MVTENGQHLLRVDVHSDRPECRAFEDAILWQGLVIVGFGERVHAVSLRDHTVVTLEANPYFGSFRETPDYLLIATGERLLCMEPDRSVRWTSEILGIDGVVVGDAGPGVIRGDGEWDPPGGWRPFQLSSVDGRLVRDP